MKIISIMMMSVVLINAQDLYSILSQEKHEASTIKPVQNNCPRPIKLKEINDNKDVETYNTELHEYKVCIDEFQRKYTKIYNKTKDSNKRLAIAKGLEKSQKDWMTYSTLEDVEQNQKVLATFESLSLGYEKQKEAPTDSKGD
jgi:hypothetical protein